MEPIVCTRCGQSVSNRFAAYRSMLAAGHSPADAMVALRIPMTAEGLCCRSIFLTTVDLYEFRAGKYNREANISTEFKYDSSEKPAAAAAEAATDDTPAIVKVSDSDDESPTIVKVAKKPSAKKK